MTAVRAAGPAVRMAPSSDFAHLARLSDDTGLFEHARNAVVRRRHGYCTDDVARGLVVTSRESEPTGTVLRLAECYLAFLDHAQDADGAFHNRMSHDRRWTDQPSLGDWWGRALWGLGTAAARSPVPWIRQGARQTFAAGVRRRSEAPHAMAFAGLGAAEIVRVDPDDDDAVDLLGDAAAAVGVPAEGSGWVWPHDRLTYANAALAEVVIAAGDLLQNDRLLDGGLRMLSWLGEIQVVDGRLSVLPAAGWQRGMARFRHDQQPIEVAALADAAATATAATGDPAWQGLVDRAVAWFLGDNDLGVPMWDPHTGGAYDGLTLHGPNQNQGAESTLALISTLQHARRHRG